MKMKYPLVFQILLHFSGTMLGISGESPLVSGGYPPLSIGWNHHQASTAAAAIASSGSVGETQKVGWKIPTRF